MTLPPSIEMQRVIDKAIINNFYLICLRVNRPCGVDEMRGQNSVYWLCLRVNRPCGVDEMRGQSSVDWCSYCRKYLIITDLKSISF
jgi:hypothetical protein